MGPEGGDIPKKRGISFKIRPWLIGNVRGKKGHDWCPWGKQGKNTPALSTWRKQGE